LSGTGFQGMTGHIDDATAALAEVVVEDRAGNDCRDTGSWVGQRDVGLSHAGRRVQGSRGRPSDVVGSRESHHDLTKSDDPCPRTRGHFRTLLHWPFGQLVSAPRIEAERRDRVGGDGFEVLPCEMSTDRPAMLLLPSRVPLRALFTLEADAGPAEPLFVASTWTKVTTGIETGAQRARRPTRSDPLAAQRQPSA